MKVKPDLERCQSYAPSWETIDIALNRNHKDVSEGELLSGMTRCSNKPTMIVEGPRGSGSVCKEHLADIKKHFKRFIKSLKPIE